MNKYVVKDNDSIVIETTPGLRQGFSIHGACDKLNELKAKVGALESALKDATEYIAQEDELAENWEKTAETYKFRLDKALRDNADLGAEKQALNAKIEALEGE